MWHIQWFYCKNHELSLPPFVGWLPKFAGSWTKEPTIVEMLEVLTLAKKVSKLKRLGLIGVSATSNWLACESFL
jgi:hypothetical protein